MEKRCFLLVLLFLLLFSNIDNANAIGISPTETRIGFEPGIERNITLTLLNTADHKINSSIGFGGSLAKYVYYTWDKNIFFNARETREITVTIRFPEEIEPGTSDILVNFRELPLEEVGGISAFGEVSSHIYVTAPYPGTYARISLVGNDANQDEEITLKITANNLGKRAIPTLVVYTSITDNKDNEKDSFVNSIKELNSGDIKEVVIPVNTKEYQPGDYKARAYAKYNTIKTNEEETTFRIGHLFVNLTGYTFTPLPNSIYRVSLNIESRWNSPLENVYAVITILERDGGMLSTFKTPSVSMNPWERTTISSFLDASSIKPDEYTAEISLRYSEKETTIKVPLIIEKERNEWESALVILWVVIVIIIADYFWLRRKAKKYKKGFEL